MAVVNLSWNDNNMVEQGYYVYRSTETLPEEPQNPIVSLPPNTTTYKDTDPSIQLGKQYFYKVGAYIKGTVMYSDEVSYIPIEDIMYAITNSNDVVKYYATSVNWNTTLTTPTTIETTHDSVVLVTDGNEIKRLGDGDGSSITRHKHSETIKEINVTDDLKYLLVNRGNRLLVIDYNQDTIVFYIDNVHFVSSGNEKVITAYNNILSIYDYNETKSWEITHGSNIKYIDADNDHIAVLDQNTYYMYDYQGNLIQSGSAQGDIIKVHNGLSIVAGSNLTVFNNSSVVWDLTPVYKIVDMVVDVNGTIFTVQSDAIRLYSSSGYIKDTLISNNNHVEVPKIPNDIENGFSISAKSYHGTDLIGVVDNTINNVGILGLEYSIGSNYTVTNTQTVHPMENEITFYEYSIGSNYTVTNTQTVHPMENEITFYEYNITNNITEI